MYDYYTIMYQSLADYCWYTECDSYWDYESVEVRKETLLGRGYRVRVIGHKKVEEIVYES